jgi:hypothetical protein
MTVRTPGAVPPGMPAHLWEAAKRDVRGVIPDWLRSAKENGAEAPAHIREVARRAAKAGAGLGMAIAVGSQVEGLASEPEHAAVAPVAQVTAEGPPGLDEHAAVPPATPEAPPLAEAFRVPDPGGAHGGWLNVEMYQDVVVNEGVSAMHNVDAFQYLVISDDAGRSYVFKEHHHASVSEPPVRENDLLIHERSQVHVVENADGSFSVATVGYDRSVQGIEDDAPADVPAEAPADDAPPADHEVLDPPLGIDFTPPAAEPVPAAAGGEPDALDAPARALSVVEADDTPADRHDDTPPDHHGDTAPDQHEGTDHDQHEATGAEPDDDLAGNDPPDAGDLAV